MKPLLLRVWRYLKHLGRNIAQDRVTMWAAAISFFAVLSALPMLLLMVAGTAQFLGSHEEALSKIMAMVSNASPSSVEMVRQILIDLIDARGAIGLVGAVSLLWVGSQIFLTLEGAINRAWGIKKRAFWKSRLLALGMTVLLGILGLSSIGLTWAVAALRGTGVLPAFFDETLNTTAGILLPVVLSFFMFYILYKIMPNTFVPWRIAALGAGFSAIAWEIAKQAFGFYLNHMARYQSLYGSLAGVVILIIWVYYSAVIILIGAEIASIAQGADVAEDES